MSQKPKLLLYDLDGTLVRFHKEFLFDGVNKLLIDFGLKEVSQKELEESFSDFEFFRFVKEEKREDFLEFFWSNFNYVDSPPLAPIKGVLETLKFFKENNVLQFIVTARVKESIGDRLKETGFLNYLDGVVCRENLSVDWRDKVGSILLACKKAKIPPKEAFMIGDIPPDIESAKSANVSKKVAVLTGGIKRTVLEKSNPDYILNNVNELVNIWDV